MPSVAGAQNTGTGEDTSRIYDHQLRLGIDLSRPVTNLATGNRYLYEVQADYAFRKEMYGVAEVGFGGYKADYNDLNYRTTNAFVRVGFDKGVMRRQLPTDWDGGIFGLRYAAALLNRSELSYTINNPIWGSQSGTQPADNYFFHWVELTGGLRIEVKKNIFTGWNIRGKFLLSNVDGESLKPAFIAGFGRTDNRTAFDFNLWLLYALRWQRK